MPLRKRVSLAAAAAVALVVAIALVVCYGVVRGQLLDQVNSELNGQYQLIKATDGRDLTPRGRLPGQAPSQGGPAPYVWFVASGGQHMTAVGDMPLPVTGLGRAVAGGREDHVFTDATDRGIHLRLLLFHATLIVNPQTGEQVDVAVVLGRPLTQVDSLLSDLRFVLALVFVAGVLLAALLSRMAARRVLAPLAEVTQTAQTIGETDDLSLRLNVHTDDEVGTLAARFNAMLERLARSRSALDDSVRSQRQLVADASHELRTPVTSLRTNIEVLLAGGELEPEERERLLADVVEQSEELSQLVADLIEVARGDLPDEGREDVRLDHVVEEALVRAHRNSPATEFRSELEPVLVRGSGERLARAVNNLLENAALHNAPGAPVDVTLAPQGVSVRDHGEGIDPADLPHIFERFYRGAAARARQGSGLGLAIVRQVAESHGGSVSAANAPGGGAIFTLTLPGRPVTEARAYELGGFTTRA